MPQVHRSVDRQWVLSIASAVLLTTDDRPTGKEQRTLLKESSSTPTALRVLHPVKQLQQTNPCWQLACSHLCLLSPSPPSAFRCACPLGQRLDADQRTCRPSSASSAALVIATYAEMFQVTHQQIGKDSVVHLPTRGLDNMGAVAYNPLGHDLIYSDLSRRTISSMHLDTFRERVLFQDADAVEGLAVDVYTETVYWTQVAQGLLVVAVSIFCRQHLSVSRLKKKQKTFAPLEGRRWATLRRRDVRFWRAVCATRRRWPWRPSADCSSSSRAEPPHRSSASGRPTHRGTGPFCR